MNIEKKATIYDVANACEVSAATVSRVLSSSTYPVKAATKEKILQVAKQLNYTPNLLGKALKTRQVRDIGVIVPNISNSHYSLLLQGVYDKVIEEGYTPILLNSYRNPEIEEKNIELLMRKQTRGIIIVSISSNTAAIKNAISHGCQVVMIEQDTDVDCLKIGFNFRKGAYLAAQHLIENGHKKIGFIGAPLDRPSRVQMLEGYKQSLIDANLPVIDKFIHLNSQEIDGASIYEFENGMAAAKGFCDKSDRPTGYMCINDMTALGAMKAFTQHGLKIPEDVSVIGFDNIPYAKIAIPELTTIDQCAYEMGILSSRMLIEHIEDVTKPNVSVVLEPTLVVRHSVGRVC